MDLRRTFAGVRDRNIATAGDLPFGVVAGAVTSGSIVGELNRAAVIRRARFPRPGAHDGRAEGAMRRLVADGFRVLKTIDLLLDRQGRRQIAALGGAF